MNSLSTGDGNSLISGPKDLDIEYIIVSDSTSEVIKSSNALGEIRKLANLIRKSGGNVTIFKSTKL